MKTDYIVVGAGMAGASAAFELAKLGTVALLEREERPGYHTTGRSAAMLMGGYGQPEFRALTLLSDPFLHAPPPGFAEASLLKQRGCLYVGDAGEAELVAAEMSEMLKVQSDISLVDADWIVDRVPIMRRERLSAGFRSFSSEIDVAAGVA